MSHRKEKELNVEQKLSRRDATEMKEKEGPCGKRRSKEARNLLRRPTVIF